MTNATPLRITLGIILAIILAPVTYGAWITAMLIVAYPNGPLVETGVSVLLFIALAALNVAGPLVVAFRWPALSARLKKIPMPVLLLTLGLLTGAAIVVMGNGGPHGYQISVPGGM